MSCFVHLFVAAKRPVLCYFDRSLVFVHVAIGLVERVRNRCRFCVGRNSDPACNRNLFPRERGVLGQVYAFLELFQKVVMVV